MRLFPSLVVVAALEAWAFPPLDAPLVAQLQAHPELASGQAQLEAGDFELAVETLTRALSRRGLSEQQAVEAYRLLGLAHLYLGDEAKAKEAFEKLLLAHFDYELPRGQPPKVQVLFDQVKEALRRRRVKPVTLQAKPVGDQDGGRPLEVEATIDDLPPGGRAVLFYRRSGATQFGSVEFERRRGSSANAYWATVPAFELPGGHSPYGIDYYIEAQDSSQRRLAGQGDSSRPQRFRVLPDPRGEEEPSVTRPWFRNPLVWVGVGAAALGAATGAVLVLTSNRSASLPITIRVEAAR